MWTGIPDVIRRIPWVRSGARARPRPKYVEGLEAESGGREICTKGTLRGLMAGSNAKSVIRFSYIIFFFSFSFFLFLLSHQSHDIWGTGISYNMWGRKGVWCWLLQLLTDFETDPYAMIDSSRDGFGFDPTSLEGRGNS